MSKAAVLPPKLNISQLSMKATLHTNLCFLVLVIHSGSSMEREPRDAKSNASHWLRSADLLSTVIRLTVKHTLDTQLEQCFTLVFTCDKTEPNRLKTQLHKKEKIIRKLGTLT